MDYILIKLTIASHILEEDGATGLHVFVSGCPDNCQVCTYDGSNTRCVDGGCDDSSYFDNNTGTCISTSIVLSYFTFDNSKQKLNTHLFSLQATTNTICHCCDDSVILVQACHGVLQTTPTDDDRNH